MTRCVVYGLSLVGMGFWRTAFGLDVPQAADMAQPVETRATVASTGTGIQPPPRPTSETVTVETALGIAAVYRAVWIIQTSVSQMELRTFRSGVEVDAPALVRTPNVDMTQGRFVEETVQSLATYGNAYWRVQRSGNGQVSNLVVLDPRLVGVELDMATGRPIYTYNGSEVRRDRFKHLKLMSRAGEALGLGPIQAARGELTAALRLRSFADNWFDTTTMPEGYLTTDLALSPAESEQFATAWRAFLRENDRVGVLSRGMRYEPVRIKPAEAQFLEMQQASVVSIARLFGIPPIHLLAEVSGTSNTYVNQQELNLLFLQTTLTRYMSEIESALSSLLPGRVRVEFNEDQLLRMNSQLRTEIDVKQVEAGLRTVNEIRARDGLTSLPWGDERPAAKRATETKDGDAA